MFEAFQPFRVTYLCKQMHNDVVCLTVEYIEPVFQALLYVGNVCQKTHKHVYCSAQQ
jgi:hypothetical protein